MSPLLHLCLLGLLSILCQWLAFRLRLPAILPLLLTGLMLGPALGLLQPDQLLGPLLFPIVSMAVAVILFEGSLSLRFDQLRGQNKMVRNLVLPGMVVTFAIATVAAHYILALPLPVAALLGSLVVVTGPTVITPLLRSIRVNPKIATILQWEGILIDPIGALLAVLVYEFLSASQGAAALPHALSIFGFTIATGLVIGALGGYLLAYALRHRWLPHYLETIAVLTLMLAAFGISNELMHESGLLTVTVMGIWLANSDDLDLERIIEFKETLSVLLISALFILLAARLEPSVIALIDLQALAWLAVLILIARPIAVWLCGLGNQLHWRELLLLGWIAPRGIVAAAISALFALKLQQLGIAGADKLVALVFLVIVTTVVLQSVLTPTVVKWLGQQAPPCNGVLIFGCNPLAQAIAAALTEHKIPALLCDTNWDNLSHARMQGLQVYYGNPMSEHAQSQLDLSLIKRLMVLSPYRQQNTEIAYHYQDLLGKPNIYRLAEPNTIQSPRKQQRHHHQSLFNGQTLLELERRLMQGWAISSTTLSPEFVWQQYQMQNPYAVPLLALPPKGRVKIFSQSSDWLPQPEWEVMALLPPNEKNGHGAV
ncbi:sodium:proton antiporter [uncultured Ferrimonas sp.]|uniref:cation:proton antiporter n=1 Tax=uncultured Ferrimonas sp. TaxID=432640 RepID=UPI0026067966|nr:sodium:proton antiporter [uncultured Ferrimonas sp.]